MAATVQEQDVEILEMSDDKFIKLVHKIAARFPNSRLPDDRAGFIAACSAAFAGPEHVPLEYAKTITVEEWAAIRDGFVSGMTDAYDLLHEAQNARWEN